MESLVLLKALEPFQVISRFTYLFKCSKWRSHEIFLPFLPLALINLDHLSCAALRRTEESGIVTVDTTKHDTFAHMNISIKYVVHMVHCMCLSEQKPAYFAPNSNFILLFHVMLSKEIFVASKFHCHRALRSVDIHTLIFGTR